MPVEKHQFYIETFKLGHDSVYPTTFHYPPTKQLIVFLRKLQDRGYRIVFLSDMTTGRQLLNRR